MCACTERNTPSVIIPGGNTTGQTIEWEPVAKFDVSSNFNCEVVFFDQSKGIKFTYDYGDGWCNDYYPENGTISLSGSARHIKHTYGKKGRYTVIVTAYGESGKKATASQTIDVQ